MGTDHGTLVATLSTKHNLDQGCAVVTQENACGIRIVRLTARLVLAMVPVAMCPLIGVAFSQAQAEPQIAAPPFPVSIRVEAREDSRRDAA